MESSNKLVVVGRIPIEEELSRKVNVSQGSIKEL